MCVCVCVFLCVCLARDLLSQQLAADPTPQLGTRVGELLAEHGGLLLLLLRWWRRRGEERLRRAVRTLPALLQAAVVLQPLAHRVQVHVRRQDVGHPAGTSAIVVDVVVVVVVVSFFCCRLLGRREWEGRLDE